MNIDIATAIVAEDSEHLSLHPDYSGRGMYGRETAAISTNDRWQGNYYYEAVYSAMINEIHEEIENCFSEGDGEASAIAGAVESAIRSYWPAVNATTDNMGLGTIWY